MMWYSLPFALLFMGAFAVDMTKVELSWAQKELGAFCLDGSAPIYYIYRGAKKWYIHHEGGGWCTSLANCHQRSQGRLGSSKGYGPTTPLPGGYFSADQKVNPLMYNWNKVFLVYCDGGSFAGNNDTISSFDGHPLYFRGFRNLQAYFKSLFQSQGLDTATEVVISGCSAGGLATYLHVDWWAAKLPHTAKVRGLPDSGFFLDMNSPFPNGPRYAKDMRWVFHQMNATDGVNQRLSSQGKCFFAEHTSPHINTPFFPLQSVYDSWQTVHVLGSNTDAKAINKFGADLEHRFIQNVLHHPKNGAFLDSCHHHCGSWNEIVINGLDSSKAFEHWYTSDSGTYVQGKVYPCEACCKP